MHGLWELWNLSMKVMKRLGCSNIIVMETGVMMRNIIKGSITFTVFQILQSTMVLY